MVARELDVQVIHLIAQVMVAPHQVAPHRVAPLTVTLAQLVILNTFV